LYQAALNEEEEQARSKLEPYASAIAVLRQRKEWKLRRIREWLHEKGCDVSIGWLSEWYKGCEPELPGAEAKPRKPFVVPIGGRRTETPDLSLNDPEDL
jgi:hypothetical protein